MAAACNCWSSGMPDDHCCCVQELPGADWKKGLEPGARLRARIIYVDAAAKRVCLSLLPHLVAGSVNCGLPPINALYEVRQNLEHGSAYRVISMRVAHD